MRDFLSIAPQMAFIPNSNGNYPLHVAIRYQQSFAIVYELFKAFPDMVQIKDAETSLLPFMIAAVENWAVEVDQITITYILIREDPNSIIAS